MYKRAFSFVIISALFSTSTTVADPVYRWKDERGVTHYSSTAPNKDAKPADLPKIVKGDPKYAKHQLVSCEGHGGVNCPAGADEDGSVICLDGFRNATLRFRFSCSVPKLSVNNISEVAADGSFTVMVRNTKSVDAKGIKVTYKAPEDKMLLLVGAQDIGPFGAEEYKYIPPPGTSHGSSTGLKLTISNVEISCSNCP